MKTYTHARTVCSNLSLTAGRAEFLSQGENSLEDVKYVSAGSTQVLQKANGSRVSSFQHISSRRHKDRAAGKPAKHKYSPYTKTQKGPAKQPVSLQPRVTSHLVVLAPSGFF